MSRKLTQSEFEDICHKSHNVKHEYLTPYKGNKQYVKVKCGIHGEVFDQIASTHMSGACSCTQCIRQKRDKTRGENLKALCGDGYKYCKTCETCKPFEAFAKARTGSFGLYSKCKVCCSIRSKEIRSDKEVQDALNNLNKEYYKKNKDKIGKRTSEYRKNNIEIYRKASREWTKRNPEKTSEKCTQRRAAKLRAIPSWALDEWDSFLVENIYELRVLRDKVLNIKHNVDHIVPLQSEFVCGLHCSANLQILTFLENMVKGNRHWPDMW